jgi:hypothetical protein
MSLPSPLLMSMKSTVASAVSSQILSEKGVCMRGGRGGLGRGGGGGGGASWPCSVGSRGPTDLSGSALFSVGALLGACISFQKGLRRAMQ